jgi:WD40 repeat protein
MRRLLLIALAPALVAAAPPQPPVLRSHRVLSGHAENVSCLAFRPDGKALATGSRGLDRKTRRRWGEFKLWELGTGKPAASWQALQDEPSSLAFSPDGRTLLSITSSLERVCWNISSGKASSTFPPRPEHYSARSLSFSSDGKTVGAYTNRMAFVWDAISGKELYKHSWKIHGSNGVLSNDLRLVASPNYQDVDLWDIRTGKLVHALLDHRGSVSQLALSRDDRLLAAGCTRETDDNEYVSEAWLWDVKTGTRKRVISLGNLYSRSVAFSPDGRLLAVAGSLDLLGAGEVRLFATGTGVELGRVRPRGVRWIHNLKFSPDGKMLAASCDRDVWVWSVVLPRRAKKTPGACR